MATYIVTIKEIDNAVPLTTSITTDKDLDYVREFFGCEDSDVEWCTIKRINDE